MKVIVASAMCALLLVPAMALAQSQKKATPAMTPTTTQHDRIAKMQEKHSKAYKSVDRAVDKFCQGEAVDTKYVICLEGPWGQRN